jgi:hypothetical protein
MDKNKLYGLFEYEVVPLLDLLYQIQENQNSKFTPIFAYFYYKLFCSDVKLKRFSRTKCKFKLSKFLFYNIVKIF